MTTYIAFVLYYMLAELAVVGFAVHEFEWKKVKMIEKI